MNDNKNIYEDILREYNELSVFLQGYISDLNTDALRNYIAAAALKIWAANVLYSLDYTGLLSALYGETINMEQTMTAMGCCGDTERVLGVPEFFRETVKEDRAKDSRITEELLGKIASLLVACALVNGDFTIEEAAVLDAIMSNLKRYAENEGLNGINVINYRQRITAKNEVSYLQNDLLAAEVYREKAAAIMNDENSVSGNNIVNTGANIPDKNDRNINLNNKNDNLSVNHENDDSQESYIEKHEEAATITRPEEDSTETMESLLAELDGLVGLDNVKNDVHSLMNFIKVTKIREQRGMKVPTMSYHLVFTGNPGTGKSTVARLVAKLYYHMGLLPEGQLVETDRSALVAGYLGQTAIKTQKVIQQAMGGVLFIDEAYSLAGDEQDSYGKEAVETILKAMEDHRDELVVIVAGYTELMHKFIDSNPGLSSRFSKYFEFADYSGQELLDIFKRFCDKNGYNLETSASEALKQEFDRRFMERDEHFGNARTARNIFEKAINAQADRIAQLPDITDKDLTDITLADIAAAIGGQTK